MGSSRTDDWPTDPRVFAALDDEFGPFDLDPCASSENAKCPRFFTRADDGLAQHWTGRVFMNPPYGRELPRWMAKAYESAQNGCELVICLVPARTDTAWWHEYAARGEVRFLRGRLTFGGCENPAPFPSAVVVFRNALDVTKPPGQEAVSGRLLDADSTADQGSLHDVKWPRRGSHRPRPGTERSAFVAISP
jgi:site-specific DNA-methyltransferase (adenine-specific)